VDHAKAVYNASVER